MDKKAMMMAIQKRRQSRVKPDEMDDGMDMMKAESIPGSNMISDDKSQEDESENPDLAPEIMDRPDEMGEQAEIADTENPGYSSAPDQAPLNTEGSAEELKRLEMMYDPRDEKTRGFSGVAMRKMRERIDEIKKANKV